MKNTQKLIFIFVILLAFGLRFYQLNKYPPSLFSDEVDLGYQAYSFLKTGRDYYGNFLPISFHSFADFRAPLYLYSAAGTIAALGMNEWGVRLPAAIFGVLGVAAFFLLVLKISKNYNFSLLSALVLTILPWHIHYSRAGFEATALFFLLCLGLYFFYRFLEKKTFISLAVSLVFFSLCFYTYATARLFLPLLALVALLIYRKEIFSAGRSRIFFSILICFLVLLPFAKDTFLGEGLHRFSYLNIFSDSNLKLEINRQRLVDAVHGQTQKVGMSTPFFAYFFHNKPLSWTLEAVNNYVSGFSFDFLFSKGDPNLRHGIGRLGNLLWVFLPFLILGLFKLLSLVKGREKGRLSQKEALFFLAFILISPLPASITLDGGMHASRLFFLVLPLSLSVALGIWEAVSWFKGRKSRLTVSILILVLTALNLIYYLHFYYYHYPVESEKFWHFGFKEGIQAVAEKENQFDQVIFSNSYESPLIFYLFWTKYDPSRFKPDKTQSVNNDWFAGKVMGKYAFGKIKSPFWQKTLPGVRAKALTGEKIPKILILAGRYDFGEDLEEGAPLGLVILEKISLPSVQPVFYLLRSQTMEEVRQEMLKSLKRQ